MRTRVSICKYVCLRSAGPKRNPAPAPLSYSRIFRLNLPVDVTEELDVRLARVLSVLDHHGHHFMLERIARSGHPQPQKPSSLLTYATDEKMQLPRPL